MTMTTVGEWRADPSGRHEYRWWDGTAWTDHVSDHGANSTDPMAGAVTAPPYAPPARKRAKWPWVLGAILLFFVLAFAGCIAVVAVGVNEAVNELNAAQERHAITSDQFDAVEIGMSQAEVTSALGKEPQSAQEFVNEGVFSEQELRSGCIYYNRSGGSWGDTYQFCFEDDALTSKNAYG